MSRAVPDRRVTLGLRAHSGWGVVVAVSGGSAVLRRRLEMTDRADIPSSQPYHHAAENLNLEEAEAFLAHTKAAAVKRASDGLREALAVLTGEGYRVTGAAVLLGSGKPLPELVRILAAHPLVHTAEGVFFREILQGACEACGLPITGIRELDVLAESAGALGISVDELRSRVTVMGKALGSPWTSDEKLSSAAALAIAR
jgi:hypothetical protein